MDDGDNGKTPQRMLMPFPTFPTFPPYGDAA
jgi:hypothetical protein